jgi:hypothetical protein
MSRIYPAKASNDVVTSTLLSLPLNSNKRVSLICECLLSIFEEELSHSVIDRITESGLVELLLDALKRKKRQPISFISVIVSLLTKIVRHPELLKEVEFDVESIISLTRF